MSNYRIAFLPGDGIGPEVCEAARLVLDQVELDAEYIHGDIGWEFWKTEGDALPARTLDLLRATDCALFGAITSKPLVAAERELTPELRGPGPYLPEPHRPHEAATRSSYLPSPLQSVSG